MSFIILRTGQRKNPWKLILQITLDLLERKSRNGRTLLERRFYVLRYDAEYNGEQNDFSLSKIMTHNDKNIQKFVQFVNFVFFCRKYS